MSEKLDIQGNIPAVVTPFNTGGDLVIDAFAEMVEWHLAEGADGICVAGDNGEAWALPLEERRSLAETAVKQVRGRVPVLMGTNAITAKQSIQLAEIAATAGVDALLLQPQAYVLKGSTEQIVRRYRMVAEAVPLPIVAYNSPRRTGLNMDPHTLSAVCDAAPVVALKESSRDFFHVTLILESFSDRIAVLLGPSHFIIPGLALGGRGFISSGPELLGSSRKNIIEIAYESPSPRRRRLHFQLTKVYEALMGTGTWPAALKAALNMIGVQAGWPREPVSPLAPEEEQNLKATMTKLGLISTERLEETGKSRRLMG